MPTERWKSDRVDLLVLAVIFLVTLVVFDGLVLGRNDPVSDSLRGFEPWKSHLSEDDARRHEAFASDPTTETYAWAIYTHETLSRGVFPLWNNRIFSGTPFAADRLNGLYNPLVIIPFWLFPAGIGLTVIYFVNALLSGWFMYLFLKAVGISRPAALFGSLTYLLQGPYIFWGGICSSETAYIAMSLYYLERTLDRGDKPAILGFIVTFSLFATTGYPQTVLHALYILVPYVLFTRRGDLRRALPLLAALAAMLALAFLLGAMQHLPTIELFLNSLRSGSPFREGLYSTSAFELYDSPASLLALFLPNLWGDYLSNSAGSLPPHILALYNHAYMGILAAFAFLFSLVVWRNRHARFFIVLGLLGAVFVAWNGLYFFVARILPGFRISGSKPYFMLFTSIAIVAAFVLDKLLRDLQADEILARKVRGVGARVLAGVIGLVVVVALGYSVPGLFNADDISRNLGILKAFFLVWAAISVLGMYAGKRIDIKWAVVGVIALELFDLLPYSFHYKLSVPRGRTCFETPGIRFLEDRMETEGPFRIFRDRNTVLPPNSPMIFHLDEIGGYESSISAGYTGFFSAIDATMSRNPRTLDLPHNYDTYTQPFWSFLGVRYLIAASPMPRLPQPWGLVYQDDLCIYENPDWLPRWFLVPAIMRAESIDEGYRLSRTIDPRAIAVAVGVDPADLPPGLRNIMAPVSNISGDAPVQSCDGVLQTEYYGPDELRLNSNCDRDSFLVFSDACFPGWRAWLDGKEVKVYRTDGIVKGIVLPSGSHKVRFLFDPVSGKIGWLLVLVGAILTPIMMRPTQRLLSISKQ